MHYFSKTDKQVQQDMRIQSTELLRSSQSWDMTALPDYPSGRPELVVNRMVFPVGAKTGWHHHNVINYGIVEQGELTIVCQNGAEHTFRKGEALIEVVGTIHRGENRGNEPVILNMFYASAPGQTITVQHPEVTGITTRKVINHRQSTPANRADVRLQELVKIIGKQTLPRKQLIAELGLRQTARRNFMDNYIKPAQTKGLICFAFPNSPNKPGQAYRLTAAGLELLNQLNQNEQK